MSFYGFAITFRHNLDGTLPSVHFFANQIFRDKKFPRSINEYKELKQYVSEHYREDIVEGFEFIWNKYQIALIYDERKSDD